MKLNRIHRFGFVGFGIVVKILGASMLSRFLKWGLLRIRGFCYNGMPHVTKGEKEMTSLKGKKYNNKLNFKFWGDDPPTGSAPKLIH